MSFDASAVPSDIWFEIASFTGFKEVLSLEATCKFFREVVLNRLFWIERLRALEQDRAPDLPPHVSIDDLTLEQLRTLVVRAHRRVLNYTGPAPMRPTRETTVRVGFVNSDGTAGRPLGYMLKMKLLPGGVLLLVLWSEGDLQCWTVPGGKCVWSYRWQPEAEDMPPMKVCSFAYDMQANGDVRVLVVSESTDSNVFERTLEIFQILPREMPREKTPVPLYKHELEHLNRMNEQVRRPKLSGDVWTVCTATHLIVTFWKEDRSVVIRECFPEDVHLVDDYVVGVIGLHEDKSIIAFRLSSIRNIRPSASAPGLTQILTLERDIPYVSCPHPRALDHHWTFVTLSICTFHWKPEAERKRNGISITMSAHVYEQGTNRVFPVLDFVLFTTATDTAGLNASAPKNVTLGSRAHTISCVSRPSQGGSVLVYFRDEPPVENPEEEACMLATVSCTGEVTYRTLNNLDAYRTKLEFYSGALYFSTLPGEGSVVIQYFD